MRLIDTTTGQFIERVDPHTYLYAILSHTWDGEAEQTYQQLKEIQRAYGPDGCRLLMSTDLPITIESHGPASDGSSPATSLQSIWDDPRLSPKIYNACKIAREEGFRYLWIDSCCIEQQSSAELSEAINSMYAWYRDSKLCYAFLVDVSGSGTPEDCKSQLSQSRWFRRGWTLQELIAPSEVVFLGQQWEPLGTKHSLAQDVEEITGIDQAVLRHDLSLDRVSVARRMSWASGRETARVEDEAYSLLGIFDINMTTDYGEGRRAFSRLQQEILTRIPDQTLFAWGNISPHPPQLLVEAFQVSSARTGRTPRPPLDGFLASSPRDFHRHATAELKPLTHDEFLALIKLDDLSPQEFMLTPYGIRTDFPVVHIAKLSSSERDYYIAVFACTFAPCPNSSVGGLLGRLCVSKRSRRSDLTQLRLTQYGPFVIPSLPELWDCIESLTVYLHYLTRERTTSQYIHDQTVNQREYNEAMSIKVLFPTWGVYQLKAQGYSVTTTKTPTGYDDSHRVSLYTDSHTIHVTYKALLLLSKAIFWSFQTQLVSPRLSTSDVSNENVTSEQPTLHKTRLQRGQTRYHRRIYITLATGQEICLTVALSLVSAACYHLSVDISEAKEAHTRRSKRKAPELRAVRRRPYPMQRVLTSPVQQISDQSEQRPEV